MKKDKTGTKLAVWINIGSSPPPWAIYWCWSTLMTNSLLYDQKATYILPQNCWWLNVQTWIIQIVLYQSVYWIMVGPLDLCWGNLPQLEHTDKYCHSSTWVSSMYVPWLQRCQNNTDSKWMAREWYQDYTLIINTKGGWKLE